MICDFFCRLFLLLLCLKYKYKENDCKERKVNTKEINKNSQSFIEFEYPTICCYLTNLRYNLKVYVLKAKKATNL